jgi:hypothetical protein
MNIGPSQAGSRVIVFAPDFMGMVSLPAERHTELVVDANAVSTSLVPPQRLQTIAGWAA